MKNFTKESAIEFCILAGKRALWTFAQVALAMIVYGMPFSEVDWKGIVDVALTAAVISILKSIVIGMPEFANDGNLSISDTTCEIHLGSDEQTIKNKKSVRLKVVKEDKN